MVDVHRYTKQHDRGWSDWLARWEEVIRIMPRSESGPTSGPCKTVRDHVAAHLVMAMEPQVGKWTIQFWGVTFRNPAGVWHDSKFLCSHPLLAIFRFLYMNEFHMKARFYWADMEGGRVDTIWLLSPTYFRCHYFSELLFEAWVLTSALPES